MIRLTDSMTRQKVELRPIDPKNVRMYVCGPTVYDRAHLGNARAAVVYDVLFRLLRHVYGPEHVTYVRNLTDIDDKIIARARETGRTVEEVSDETIRWYHEDMDALGCLRPTHEPRATEFVPQMVAMIQTLIARGHAYERDGHVLFLVSSYGEYGALSGRSVEDMIAGARVEVAPYKSDPMDFVLWKPSGEGIPGWESPWGRGRPGWHIECSAMARDLLGGAFDVHGGGQDLKFPHHENEIAQSRCAHPDEGFAGIWMHNEMLMIEGRKMSKSLGNFITARDALKRFDDPVDVSGTYVRLALLQTRYRNLLYWTDWEFREARREALNWLEIADDNYDNVPDHEVVAYLRNDLNVAGVLKRLRELWRGHEWSKLGGSLSLLGINARRRTATEITSTMGYAVFGDERPPADELYGPLRRWQIARERKDFIKADEIREKLRSVGIEVRATRHGPEARKLENFDRTALEAIRW